MGVAWLVCFNLFFIITFHILKQNAIFLISNIKHAITSLSFAIIVLLLDWQLYFYWEGFTAILQFADSLAIIKVLAEWHPLIPSWLLPVTNTMNQATVLNILSPVCLKLACVYWDYTSKLNVLDSQRLRWFATPHLYTVEQYRRRGLASAVVRMMCRHIQDQGDVPFCYMYNDNHTSTTLFHSLGFTGSQEQFFSLKTDNIA